MDKEVRFFKEETWEKNKRNGEKRRDRRDNEDKRTEPTMKR